MKRIFKILGLAVAALVVLLLIAYGFVYVSMTNRMNRQYAFSKEMITVAGDSASIANGRHLAIIRGCNDCHGSDLGGKVLADDAMLGRLASSNLTRGKGGLQADFSVADWLMALNHGVNKNGRPLLMMPSQETALFSKKDLADIIAYAGQLPPVNHVLPAAKPGPVVYVMAYLNKLPLLSVEKIDHTKSLQQPEVIPGSIEQGRYLSITCQSCHRTNMKGGDPLAPGLPPVPDISATGAAGRITLQQFTATLRTGKKSNGQQMDSDKMPWKMTSHYNDDEIKALYSYLKSQ